MTADDMKALALCVIFGPLALLIVAAAIRWFLSPRLRQW